jgi:hypothetical protein
MLRTKKAKRLLTKAEQRHLTEMNIHSMAAMERTAADQAKWRKEHSEFADPCHICWNISHKLGLED